MEQTEARKLAKLKNEGPTHTTYVATTVCAYRGQFEQGPDANKWVVAIANGPIVEGP